MCKVLRQALLERKQDDANVRTKRPEHNGLPSMVFVGSCLSKPLQVVAVDQYRPTRMTGRFDLFGSDGREAKWSRHRKPLQLSSTGLAR